MEAAGPMENEIFELVPNEIAVIPRASASISMRQGCGRNKA